MMTPDRNLPALKHALRNSRLPAGYHECHNVYRTVLDCEAEAEMRSDGLDLIAARILGYLLLDPLSDAALQAVVSDITSCYSAEDEFKALCALGQKYMRAFLALFRGHNGPYQPPSDRPSRPSLDRVRDKYRALLLDSPSDLASARKQALLRDGFRCMVTHAPSMFHWQPGVKADEYPAMPLACRHIFPEALGSCNDVADVISKTNPVSAAWSTLDRLGCKDPLHQLSGVKIHRLENVMTLAAPIHALFDAMGLWFEAIPEHAHRYKVKIAPGGPPHEYFRIPNEVQFSTEENLPLPSPDFLRIHAACCRILHMSGAVEYVDKIRREMEDIGVLAEDGSSAELLIYTLQGLTTVSPG